MTEPKGLEALEAAIAHDFAILNHPPQNWVPERPGPDGRAMLDVLIVGAGMCGLTAAFHFKCLGIHNTRLIDAAPEGRQGPWRTFARMETLRSPKHLTGPASGMANLAFRAWWEAQHGATGWESLGLIDRETWADYLDWYGRVTGGTRETGVRLDALAPFDDGITARLVHDDGRKETVHARHVVLATGREGMAVMRIPPVFAAHRGHLVHHTGDAPGRELMTGRDVVVIGLGASAFDYAAEALEAGAKSVKILGRSQKLSRVNKAKQITYAGFVHGYPLLPDAEKIAILSHIFEKGIAPPRGTVQRVMRHDNVEIVLGAEVETAREQEGRLVLETAKGTFPADLVVLGTGYRIELGEAGYLAPHLDVIASWRDRFDGPAPGEFLDFPYIGPRFEFTAKPGTEARADYLARLTCFNHAAMMSLGNLANDIPAVSEGAERLTRGIAAALYLEDRPRHWRNLEAYEEGELLGDEIPGFDAYWPDAPAG
jgi:cation diffusion facilitator CzcD-associated flavoprotein CzcO